MTDILHLAIGEGLLMLALVQLAKGPLGPVREALFLGLLCAITVVGILLVGNIIERVLP